MYTAEEKQAWRQKMAGMAKKIKALSTEQQEELAGKMGTITAEGHLLSTYNCCFLWAQIGRPVVQIGGFRQWRKIGRMVRKGEHSVGYIYVPIQVKRNNGDRKLDTADDPDETDLRFRLVPVFELDQTEAA